MGEANRRRKRLGKDTSYLDLASGEVQTGRHGGDPVAILRNLQTRDLCDESRVPCNGCFACCYHAHVDVDPSIEPPANLAQLALEQDAEGNWWLQKRADGACVHLGERGCTVYEHRPNACRTYDCRVYALTGVLDSFSNGHTQPVWVFEKRTPEARAICATAQALGTIEALRRSEAGESISAQDVATAVFLSPRFQEGYSTMLTLARMSPVELSTALGIDLNNPDAQAMMMELMQTVHEKLQKAAKTNNLAS
jgi:Fe-S-cluster containining protein